MKTINFIKPVPPKKQRLLVFWFYGSLILLATCLAFTGYFHLFRLQQARLLAEDLHDLQKKAALFDDFIAKKNQLQKDKSALEEQLETLRTFHNQAESIHGLLATLALITPPTIRLSLVQGKPGKKIEIAGVAVNAQEATSFLKKLSTDHLVTDLKLAHLLPCEEKSPQGKPCVQFKFEGAWNFNQEINFED